MTLAHYGYLLRRLKTTRAADLSRRIRLWKIHRLERRGLASDPEALSWDSTYSQRGAWLKPDIVDLSLEETFSRCFSSTVPEGWLDDQSFWEFFVRLYPSDAERLVARADTICRDIITLFHWKEIGLPDPIRWSATLEPGRPEDEWPKDYYADINFYHSPNRPDRDIKLCWELNRFQHLLSLGAAWRITGDERYAQTARNHVESWMGTVVYPWGIQWSSNLEVGLRALSWARCHLMCRNSRSWDSIFLGRFITALYLHCRHLEKELTEHHTVGNHLLGEAAALFQISVLYSLFRSSEAWQVRSLALVERLVPSLILQDGVYAEQSTGYFRFVAEFLVPLVHIARHNGLDVPDVVSERLAKGMEFVTTISFNSHEVPMIGDSDSGTAIGWGLSDYWDFSPLTAAVAALCCGHEELAGLERFPAESCLLLGSWGLERFNDRTVIKESPEGSKLLGNFSVYPSGGYQVSGDGSFGIVLDSGPLGIPPGFEHGHADGLSFCLNYLAKPALLDTGTFLYNGNPMWRNYFRGSAAHNTVRVDGMDQSCPTSTFGWSGPLRTKLLHPESGHGFRALHGSLLWPNGIEHRRTIVHVLHHAVLVFDFLSGSGKHLFEWFLHFDPRWKVEFAGENWFRAFSEGDVLDLLFLGNHDDRITVHRGDMSDMGGWCSRYYGSLIPTWSIRARLARSLPFVTLIAIKPPEVKVLLPERLVGKMTDWGVLRLIRCERFQDFCERHNKDQ